MGQNLFVNTEDFCRVNHINMHVVYIIYVAISNQVVGNLASIRLIMLYIRSLIHTKYVPKWYIIYVVWVGRSEGLGVVYFK